MKKIPFKVSAKAARLIGRENVANADGAISELVKNTYDADASHCTICFLPRYAETPERLSVSEYAWFSETYPNLADAFQAVGTASDAHPNYFEIEQHTDDVKRRAVSMALAAMQDLWIIDDGDGMSPAAIEDNWMVIGTNFKEVNVTSSIGRTRTGAKGIGRFALDRLGTQCDLYSVQPAKDANNVPSYLRWHVDWNDFDGAGKRLDQVEAELTTDPNSVEAGLKSLSALCAERGLTAKAVENLERNASGTAIKIGLLRDDWNHDAVNRLYRFLGTLVPPASQRVLNIQLLDAQEPTAFGDIQTNILDDYDYRLIATVADNIIKFEIFRNELDATRLDPELFLMDDMKQENFNQASFTKKPLEYKRTFSEIWPGQTPEHYAALGETGDFSFDLLFSKRGNPSRGDLQRYPYRHFQPGPRRAWLDEFGGIKIYRDNFAVRPYGEVDGRSYDWLSLGQRANADPAAVSRKGRWRVGPANLAGTVTISRTTNIKLGDQANREGIIQNTAFASLRTIVLKVIEEFENDRSTIHFNLNELYKKQNKSAEAKSEGATIARRVNLSPAAATADDAISLAKAFEAQEDEIKELRDEQTMLRSLATLGTVLVSFSHEMSQLQDTMGYRSASLANILTTYISPDDIAGVDAPFHPYSILEEWEADDQKVRQWFSFALSTINANKRRKKWLNLKSHLNSLMKSWDGFLKPRHITLDLKFPDHFNPKMYAFEIDLDSIFNNLILNSVEAFLNSTTPKRKISIELKEHTANELLVVYEDNGPGLSPDIKDTSSIFRFAVTTKMDRAGNPTGTGLGLWILSAVVSTYGGSAKVTKGNLLGGFGMEILLPIREGAEDA